MRWIKYIEYRIKYSAQTNCSIRVPYRTNSQTRLLVFLLTLYKFSASKTSAGPIGFLYLHRRLPTINSAYLPFGLQFITRARGLWKSVRHVHFVFLRFPRLYNITNSDFKLPSVFFSYGIEGMYMSSQIWPTQGRPMRV